MTRHFRRDDDLSPDRLLDGDGDGDGGGGGSAGPSTPYAVDEAENRPHAQKALLTRLLERSG